MLQLDIRRQGIEISTEVRERLQRRLAFALGRFSRRLGHIQVFLGSVNSPNPGRGALDKRCVVVVRLQRNGDVVVEDQDSNLEVLIDRTVNRVGQAVIRELSRKRGSRRHGGLSR
jgi:ribosome-associated translation inhibitor RaiA